MGYKHLALPIVAALSVAVVSLPIKATAQGKDDAPGQQAPTNAVAPSISGAPIVGGSETASAGDWTGPSITYAYQWQRCNASGDGCSSIAGATDVTYQPGPADVGSTLRFVVTASNKNGATIASSDATAVVAPAPAPAPAPVPAPTTSTAPTTTPSTSTPSTTTQTAPSTTTAPTTTSSPPVQPAAGTGTTPTTTQTTTTSPPTGPSHQFWANDSPFNNPIPAGAAVDPSSQTWVNMLNNSSQVNSLWVNNDAWSTTLYHAPAGTPTVDVAVSNIGKRITIPYRSGWKPSPDADAHLAVIDDATGCEYEFEMLNTANMTAHSYAAFHIYSGTGAHVSDAGVTGGEMSVLAGLITPQDVASGAIRHALRLGTPINSSAHVLPATRSDGGTYGGIPEGELVRLDPNLDLTPYGLTPFETMLAKALQTYGAYNDDNAGALAVFAESTTDGSSYSLPTWGLPKSLVSHLQFISPLYSSVRLDSNTNTTCNVAH